MIIVVLDTNTIISGLLNPKSPPGRILNLATQGKFFLATSDHLIEELRRALQYEKVVDILTRRGLALKMISSNPPLCPSCPQNYPALRLSNY